MKNNKKNKNVVAEVELAATNETATPAIEVPIVASPAPTATVDDIRAQIASLRAKAKEIKANKVPGKRGRPHGATSTVTVTFGQLSDLIGQNNSAPILVSRIWVNNLAKTVGKSVSFAPETSAERAENTSEKVEFAIHE